MIVRLHSTPLVADQLLVYLKNRLCTGDLAYAEHPSAITDGWETDVYRFRLRPHADLPSIFAGPLVLRVYTCRQALPRLRHEWDVQRHLYPLGYPVAEPILYEEEDEPFGGPCMIMKQIPGRTMLDLLLHQPWQLLNGPARMAAAHVRLHRLSPDGFPAPAGDFLTRHLDAIRTMIDEYDLAGLRRGWEWLVAHRPMGPLERRPLHLDFHPINLMFRGTTCEGVLDWGDADVGDRHADIAATLILVRTAAIEVAAPWQRLTAVPGRWMLCNRYLRAYRRLLPLDKDRLCYFVAWAALRRLCRYGAWLRVGPWVTGSKSSSLRHLTPARVASLLRAFGQQTNLAVEL